VKAIIPFDQVILAELRRELTVLDDLWRRRETALKASAAPGSPAAVDAALPEARYVSLYAGQALGMAFDHLAAWRLLINGRELPMQAHLTLLRAALEGSDRCRWHVEAKVSPGVRVGRAWAARRDDQDQRRLFEQIREGGPRPQRTSGYTAAERLDVLDDADQVKEREAAGVRSVGFADETGLMKKYRHERWFRLSSGIAHGKEWPLLAMHVLEMARPGADPKVQEGILTASEPVARDLTLATLRAARTATADLEAYRTVARTDRRR
jgi:hypothetical protein